MLIIPAIDLKDGCVVRFVQGKKDMKVYSHSPLKAARHWISQGAKLLHIVDLDGAFSGAQKNLAIVKEIAQGVSVPVEVGGGLRSMGSIKALVDAGVARVILGTKAVQDKVFLTNARKKFKDKIIVSIDGKQDEVLIKGWRSAQKKIDIISFARALKDMGFTEVIYTDTLKDGTLTGPNIKGIKKLLKETDLKVIASGGIASLNDIRKLKKIEKDGVNGVIIGKALYEGKFTLKEALKLA
ncbi:MAG: 1-(5-phosphoribosyl)-5-[(5-phosphoribosylamino)methylideneamino]imidazole-4-carboxamide isomerase [Candidatus Omnitrophica bacterium]|nr:1-(5-phosphoribosyl)-5-[(5-phosphoribosylamino)methylideneamino]imidazole-4-carboxamide isomerase [Candidatus Omnitrophota bacterium]